MAIKWIFSFKNTLDLLQSFGQKALNSWLIPKKNNCKLLFI
jgi:hypothetical protein